MGQRISFYKNNNEKELIELVFEYFASFRKWYLETNKSSIFEFNELFGNENLIDYLNQNRDLQADFVSLDKKIIDELTSEFIGNYNDLNLDKLEIFGPYMYVWRYDECNQIVTKTNDKIFIALWTFITKGRSLKDGGSFDSFTNEYKIGYLNRNECMILKNKIEFHFGNHEIMKNTGLEFILQAINELTEKNKEIISAID